MHDKIVMKKISLQIAQQLVLILFLATIVHADYGLLINSLRSRESAIENVRILAKQAQNAIAEEVIMPGSGTWYRVCVGPFATKEEALEKRKSLRLDGLISDMIAVKINKNKIVYSELSEKKVPVKKQVKAEAPPVRGIITMEWDLRKDPAVAGYNVYYDTDPGKPYNPDKADYALEGPPPIRVGSDVSRITLHGLDRKKKYFLSMTSFNSSGEESIHSAEISAYPDNAAIKTSVDNNSKKIENKALLTSKAPVDIEIKKDSVVQKDPETKTNRENSFPARQKSFYKRLLPSPEGQSETPSQPIPSPPKADETESLIAPGDILAIEVPGQKEMSFDYDVDPDGNIYILMIGKVSVRGLSESGLSDKLTKLAKVYIAKGDRVLVQAVERRRYVYIQGGVRYPGWYRSLSKTTVDDLINMAGGTLSKEVYSGIKLKRKVGDKEEDFSIKGELALRPNDLIIVPAPKNYRKEADKGDLMFISIPQRQAPGRRPDTTDSADLTQSLAQNRIEIDRNGYIYIPNYGHLYVNNMTTEEIKKEIESRLPKYIAILDKVEVSIIEKKHYVQVLGHVTNPGWYNVPETANIQESVSIAGGAVDGATMSGVVIQRNLNGIAAKVKVNLYQFTITGDGRLLTPIHENDTVFVPISSNFGNIKRTLMAWSPPTERLEEDVKEKVRIFGAVHNPGIYEVEDNMTLVDLLVLASGEDQFAELTDIAIIRDGKVQTRFDLEEFLHGKSKGGTKSLPQIRGGDTVYVTRIETTTKEAQDRVYIVGKVLRPGSYELYDDMTVLQALAWAGGLTEWADSDNIMIVRMVDGKQENIPFNYDKGVRGRVPELNIRMAPNDTIIVP